MLLNISKVRSWTTEMIATFYRDLTDAFSLKQWKAAFGSVSNLNLKQAVRNLLCIAPQILIFYIVLCPKVSLPLWNIFLFHPLKLESVAVSSVAGIPKKDVTFPAANGERLHAWYFAVPNSGKTVLLTHGNGGNISHRLPLIEILLRSGVSVFAFDYQGYGRSSGSPSLENFCSDGLAAYDYIAKHACPSRSNSGQSTSQIILYGESLGGGVACYIASRRPCAAIILQSTFSSLPHLAKEKILWLRLYPDALFPAISFDNAAVLSKRHAPTLIVHGAEDHIIPCSESQALFAKAIQPKQLCIMPSVGHNDIYGPANVKELSQVLSKLMARLHDDSEKSVSFATGEVELNHTASKSILMVYIFALFQANMAIDGCGFA
ncbi:MAG TPA: alpha/beta hydrolase [Candidatus Obscuribacterales bacterium]